MIEVDLHTHTTASGHAYSTVDELARTAQTKGLKVLGITDHGINMPGGPHLYYFGNLRVIPQELYGVRVLKGVEANILNGQGNLDMPERILDRMDLVLAGLHGDTGYEGRSVEDHTRALIAAMENPYVHVIAHPGNPAYPVDMEKIVMAAKRTGKALEINDSSFRTSRPGSAPRCQTLAKLAAKYDIIVAVNSDAHFHTQVGQCDIALQTALDAGIRPERIINLSAEYTLSYLEKHRLIRTRNAV